MKFKNKLCIFFLILIFSINIFPYNAFANTIYTNSNVKVLNAKKKIVNESSNLKNCDYNSAKYLKINTNTENQVIKLLVNAYKNSITSVNLTKYKISIDEIEGIVNKSYNADLLVYNCREIQYYSYSYDNNDTVGIISFEYGNTKETFNKEYTELSEVTSKILNSINSSMTDLEKALYIHDYIVKNSEYDYDNLVNNTLPQSSYTAYGILVNHIGVCLGYANAYKLLMDILNINCIIVTSNSMNHAWNMVKINNNWYHVDTTWDDPTPDIKGRVNHNYFLVNDSEISNDHYGWYKTNTPRSNSNTFSSSKLHEITNEICYANNNWYYMLNNNIYKADINNSTSTLIKKTNSNSFCYYNNKFYYDDINYSDEYDYTNDTYVEKYNTLIKSCDLNGTNETIFYTLPNNNEYIIIENMIISDNGLITATLYNSNTATSSEITKQIINENKPETVIVPSISYKTHVQKIGWQDYVSNGVTSGTTGKGLRLEGIQIKLNNSSISGNIKYRTHVQKIGWQNYVNNDELSGTTGKSLRLEAIQIELTGEISKNYDIYYRVHSQKFGWLDWAKNGQMAGTSGFGYRLESIQIKLVNKGSAAPGYTTNCYYKK